MSVRVWVDGGCELPILNEYWLLYDNIRSEGIIWGEEWGGSVPLSRVIVGGGGKEPY
jgi:hypothetical protein